MKIRRIEPMSIARLAGAIYAAIGLLIGAAFSLFGLLGTVLSAFQRASEQSTAAALAFRFLGIGSIVFFPLFYGLMGFITAWVGAWLYNAFAARFGGVEIDIS